MSLLRQTCSLHSRLLQLDGYSVSCCAEIMGNIHHFSASDLLFYTPAFCSLMRMVPLAVQIQTEMMGDMHRFAASDLLFAFLSPAAS